jgi:hypothetical protein
MKIVNFPVIYRILTTFLKVVLKRCMEFSLHSETTHLWQLQEVFVIPSRAAFSLYCKHLVNTLRQMIFIFFGILTKSKNNYILSARLIY